MIHEWYEACTGMTGCTIYHSGSTDPGEQGNIAIIPRAPISTRKRCKQLARAASQLPRAACYRTKRSGMLTAAIGAIQEAPELQNGSDP